MKKEFVKQLIEYVVKTTLKEMDSMLTTDPNPTMSGVDGVPAPIDPVEKQRAELKAKKARQDQVKKIDKTLKMQGTQEKLKAKTWKLTKRSLEKQKNDLKRPSADPTI